MHFLLKKSPRFAPWASLLNNSFNPSYFFWNTWTKIIKAIKPTNPPSPKDCTSPMTLDTTLVPNTPAPKITSAKMLRDTNDNIIVDNSPKKPFTFPMISFII